MLVASLLIEEPLQGDLPIASVTAALQAGGLSTRVSSGCRRPLPFQCLILIEVSLSVGNDCLGAESANDLAIGPWRRAALPAAPRRALYCQGAARYGELSRSCATHRRRHQQHPLVSCWHGDGHRPAGMHSAFRICQACESWCQGVQEDSTTDCAGVREWKRAKEGHLGGLCLVGHGRAHDVLPGQLLRPARMPANGLVASCKGQPFRTPLQQTVYVSQLLLHPFEIHDKQMRSPRGFESV